MQGVLAFVMVAALLVFSACCALLWTGIVLERLTLVSAGVVNASWALLALGEAWRPRWGESRWNPPPDAAIARPNRLLPLGIALCAGTGAVAFLGYGWLTEHIALGIVAFLTGVALCLASTAVGRREAEAAQAIRTALAEYAERHDGWFPRGEVCPEAALGLLHREFPEQVTADVLRGKTAPEDAVRARLEAGELLTPETCGWYYVEGLRVFDDPRLVLFWAKSGTSRIDALLFQREHIVFFVGGGVAYVPEERWWDFWVEQGRLRAALERPNG